MRLLSAFIITATADAAAEAAAAFAPQAPNERGALNELYGALGGPNWLNGSGWNTTSDPCIVPGWFGVTCMRSNATNSSNVVGLSLPGNRLWGALPLLHNLTRLTHLDLSNPYGPLDVNANAITGSVESVCYLGLLETLLLDSNAFSGTLPSCIGTLVSAEVLSLEFNAIRGTTPDEVCSLVALQELRLRGNRLEGSIPECIGSHLTELTVLDYSDINEDSSAPGFQSLSGSIPGSLCGLAHLQELALQNTQGLSGTIPNCFGGQQPALSAFNVQGNRLSGTIPESLCGAGNLTYLYMFENSLHGTLPLCFGGLSRLEKLELSENDFTGTLPAEYCELSSLTNLVLSINSLDGTLPPCLGGLAKLEWLDLQENGFTGTLPAEYCELSSSLTHLDLQTNSLEGTLPPCLGGLAKLDLYDNSFTGTLPAEFCELSSLTHLILHTNSLEGTLPPCLGGLAKLEWLELYSNGFTGTLPPSFCNLASLEKLYLYKTGLSGTIAPCFGTSFPSVQAILLHDNHFHGPLPPVWELPSLISITLSNNRRLSGTIPASLFLQQSPREAEQGEKEEEEGDPGGAAPAESQVNHNLRTVVIEGTRIGGTLPAELCAVPLLKTLSVSGNRLIGGIPACVAILTRLVTFRAASNKLTGVLPANLDNLTALEVFDVSDNDIGGTVPPGFGDLSGQLSIASLQLNRLSCELPSSVLHWKTNKKRGGSNASVAAEVLLLQGNLFGCGKGSSLWDLEMQGASSGLREANSADFDAYSCGSSSYVIPVSLLAAVVLPCVLATVRASLLSTTKGWWQVGLSSWRLDPSFRVDKLKEATSELNRLAIGTALGSAVGASALLGFLSQAAKSPYQCQYAAGPTLGGKEEANGSRTLSVGVGIAVMAALMCSLAAWWLRWLERSSSSSSDYQEGGGCLEAAAVGAGAPGGINDDKRGFEEERLAEAQAARGSIAVRAAKVSGLALVVALLVVAPNVGYVLVVLSDLPNDRQLESEAAITMFKVLFTVTAVPQAARLAVGILVRSDGLEYVRFQLRLNIATIFSVFSNVAAPLLVVLLSDERCLKYRIYPRPAVTTETEFQYCELFIFNNNGEEVCLEYAEYNVESTYVPSFEYDGERCVSAVLSIYTPVFLASVLLAAVLPAAAEVLVVPRIAPWCHRRSGSSIGARVVLAALRSFTWNVPAVLEAEARAAAAAAAGESDSPSLSQDAPPLPPADADYLAQRIVERGFGQLMATLLVALTFGVAAPPVGGACAVASLVQLLHHRHVLGQVVDLGLIHGRQGRVPNLAGRTAVPVGCAVTAAASVTSVWACAVLGGFLDLAAVGGAAGVVLASALFLLVAADRRFNKARKRYASSASGSFSRLLRRKQQQQQQQEEKTSDKHKGRADQEAAQKGEGGGEEEEEEEGEGDGALRWSEINQAFRISKRDAAENRSSSFELKALDKTSI